MGCVPGTVLQPCDLLNGSDVSISCQYACPCEADACDMVVLDKRDTIRQQPGNICEITF